MADLSTENIKTLEQTRQRLSHLTHSLASLENLLKSGALPPWYISLPYPSETLRNPLPAEARPDSGSRHTQDIPPIPRRHHIPKPQHCFNALCNPLPPLLISRRLPLSLIPRKNTRTAPGPDLAEEAGTGS